MTNTAKKAVRSVLRGKVLGVVEKEYRLARASFANARFHWPARNMRVIMITGTNGKTTTAHYLFSILRAAGYSVGMLSTAEFRINERIQANDTNMTAIEPVELRRYLAEFKASRVDFVILEATSLALDQYRLYGIPCEVAIFTNLTQEHLDYHKTMERYAAAKAKLWNLDPKISVLNTDDRWFSYFKKVATGKLYTYGVAQGADSKLSGYKAVNGKVSFTLRAKKEHLNLTIKLAGKYNMYNAAAAATAAIGLKVSLDAIEEGIESLMSIPGRLQQVAIQRSYSVIVDYAHTPDGLEQLLTTGKDLTKGKLWLVFGSCGDRDKAKRPVMGKIAARLADKIVLTDEESYSEDPQVIIDAIKQGIVAVKGGSKKMTEIIDRKQAIKYALDNAKRDDLILITGLGHEQFRIKDGKKTPWNDADIVKKLAK